MMRAYGSKDRCSPVLPCPIDKMINKMPKMATNTPKILRLVILSWKKIGAIIQFETSENTPKGDTTEAGANP